MPLGQIAYEGWCTTRSIYAVPWHQLEQSDHEGWEAAGSAVCAALSL